MTSPLVPPERLQPPSAAWLGTDHDVREHRRLAPQVVTAWRVPAIGFSFVVALPLAAVGVAVDDLSLWWRMVMVGAAVAVVVMAVAVPVLRYRAWCYRLGEYALELERGLVVRRTTSVPYHRVQHIDVHAGVIDRALGLASLRLHTAAAGTDAALPGLSVDDAEGVRLFVLQRADRDPGV